MPTNSHATSAMTALVTTADLAGTCAERAGPLSL